MAPSFADIFYNNCINIGLLPVVLSEDEVTELTELAHEPGNHVVIDLDKQTVTAATSRRLRNRWPCQTPSCQRPRQRRADPAAGGMIDDYETSRPAFKPTVA